MERWTCKNCVYFEKHDGQHGPVTECHCYPPGWNMTSPHFPVTYDDAVACSKYIDLKEFEHKQELLEKARARYN